MSDDFDLFDDLMDLNDEVHVDRTKFEKAPFGMPGGKFKSLKHLLPVLQAAVTPDTVWVDHFGGTGVVSLNIPDCKLMVFNDRYSGITDFYRCLQDAKTLRTMSEYLEAMPALGREMWLRCRQDWASEKNLAHRAAMWFYMYRNSVIGKGAAFARATNSAPPIQLPRAMELFWPIHYKLKGFQIENLDFEVCAGDYNSVHAVHYFDPPYLHTDGGIYESSWTIEDLKRLLRCIERLEGWVALSHYPNELIESCTFWTDRKEWKVPVNSEVQAFSDQNYRADKKNVQEVDQAVEVLWIKEN